MGLSKYGYVLIGVIITLVTKSHDPLSRFGALSAGAEAESCRQGGRPGKETNYVLQTAARSGHGFGSGLCRIQGLVSRSAGFRAWGIRYGALRNKANPDRRAATNKHSRNHKASVDFPYNVAAVIL